MAIAFFEDRTDGDIVLGPAAADALARLGVTNVTVLADRDGVAIVMEGWAFDPRTAAEAASATARVAGRPPRLLYPLSDISVRAVDRKGVPT